MLGLVRSFNLSYIRYKCNEKSRIWISSFLTSYKNSSLNSLDRIWMMISLQSCSQREYLEAFSAFCKPNWCIIPFLYVFSSFMTAFSSFETKSCILNSNLSRSNSSDYSFCVDNNIQLTRKRGILFLRMIALLK